MLYAYPEDQNKDRRCGLTVPLLAAGAAMSASAVHASPAPSKTDKVATATAHDADVTYHMKGRTWVSAKPKSKTGNGAVQKGRTWVSAKPKSKTGNGAIQKGRTWVSVHELAQRSGVSATK